jgi:hypothetical protein
MAVFAQTMLLAALTAIPPAFAVPPEPPDLSDRIDRTEFYGTSTEAQLVAYDSAGEVIGTLAIWEAEGEIILASDYGDGYAEIVVVDGRAVVEGSNLDPSVIHR